MNAADNSSVGLRLPKRLVFGILVVSVLPFLLILLGLDLGSNSMAPQSFDLAEMDQQESLNMSYRNFSAAFIHTIMEWSAFCTAIFTMLLAFSYYHVKGDTNIPVIAMALFCAGCLDAFHILAADGLIEGLADNRNLIPFTWAISRSFNALIIAIVVSIFVFRTQESNPAPSKNMSVICLLSIFFIIFAYFIIRYFASQEQLPPTMFPDALITRPWDIGPLIIYIVLLLFLLPRYYAKYPGMFAHSLIISMIPQIATELHMAFGSVRLFDSHFNAAHFLKIIACLVPFLGLMLNYIATHKKQLLSANALIESEERFKLATRASREGIFDDNLLTGLTWYSPNLTGMCGYAENELVPNSRTFLDELAHPDEKEWLEALYRENLKTGEPIRYESRVKRRDGSYFWAETRADAIRDSEGNIIRVIGSVSDISERKRTQEQQRIILNAASSGIVMVNASGVITLVNSTMTDLFGYQEEEMLGQPIELLVPGRFKAEHAAQRQHYNRKPSSRGMAERSELYGLRKDGSEFPLEIGLNPIETGEGTVVIGTIVDITERQKTEEKIKRHTLDLERSNAELEQFAYVASHDLQEPLRMVASFTELLEKRYADQLDDRAREYIGFAVDGAKRMQALINDLLQYSRIGNQNTVSGHVDCQLVFDNVMSNLAVLIKETGSRVTADDLPVIHGDEVLVTQLFQNLISNAIKYVDAEKKPLIHFGVEQQASHWSFTVSDNGIGIAPEQRDRIFVIFQRLHSRSEYSGTGIGLAICKKIVELHGGRIWVESEQGKGSTFCFTVAKT